MGNFEGPCAEGDVECELALIAEAETARLQADGAGEAEVAAAASAATAAAEGEARLAATVVRRKTFEMPAMSIDDAAVALDYIDHDFYVFRNAATNEVRVVVVLLGRGSPRPILPVPAATARPSPRRSSSRQTHRLDPIGQPTRAPSPRPIRLVD